MSDKLLVLINGANQGIGYYAAQQFATSGKHHVLLGSRDFEKGQKAVEDLVAHQSVPVEKTNIDAIQIDVTSDESIKRAAEEVKEKYGHLDILVANAGISGQSQSEAGLSLREQYQAVYDTNVFGQAVCTDSFLPLLRKSTAVGGKRIIFVTSGVGSISLTADPKSEYPGHLFPIYRSSKTAENMIAVHYASLLTNEGFGVCAVCPGFTSTALNGYRGTKSPQDGVKVILTAANAKAEEVHFKFLNEEKAPLATYPW